MTSSDPRSPGTTKALKATGVVVVALALGIGLFAAMAFILVSRGLFRPLPLPPGTNVAFGGIALLLVVAGLAVRARLLADVEADSFEGVVDQYRTGVVAGSAVIEGGGLFGVVGALLTGSASLALVMGGVAVLAILSGLRSPDSLDRALQRLPR